MNKSLIIKGSIVITILIIAITSLIIYFILDNDRYMEYNKGLYFRKVYAQIVKYEYDTNIEIEYFNVKNFDETKISQSVNLILEDGTIKVGTIEKYSVLNANELYEQKKMRISLNHIEVNQVYKIVKLEMFNSGSSFEVVLGEINFTTVPEDIISEVYNEKTVQITWDSLIHNNEYSFKIKNISEVAILLNYVTFLDVIKVENYTMEKGEELVILMPLSELIKKEEMFEFDKIIIGASFKYEYKNNINFGAPATHSEKDTLKTHEDVLEYLKNASEEND